MAVITMEGSLNSANPGLVPGVGGREGGNLVEERRQAEWNWGRAREEEGSGLTAQRWKDAQTGGSPFGQRSARGQEQQQEPGLRSTQLEGKGPQESLPGRSSTRAG